MRSVSPSSSTISSQSWQETFVAEFEEDADPDQLYEMHFSVNGVEWAQDIENGEIDGRNIDFNLSFQKMSEMGFAPVVGQVVAPLSLKMTMQVEGDVQLVEIWHA